MWRRRWRHEGVDVDGAVGGAGGDAQPRGLAVKSRRWEVYIIAAVVALVVIVAWYFVLLSPVRDKISTLETQMTQRAASEGHRAADPASSGAVQEDGSAVESGPRAAQQDVAAEHGHPVADRGADGHDEGLGHGLLGITPSDPVQGAPFSVQPLNLVVTGRYFDLEDFLYRLEDYVEYRNESYLVTGRLLQVAALEVAEGPDGLPQLTVTITIDAYLWSGTGAGGGL